MSMKVVIVGSGALGLFYGSFLEKNKNKTGVEVHFLARSDFDSIQEKGILLRN